MLPSPAVYIITYSLWKDEMLHTPDRIKEKMYDEKKDAHIIRLITHYCFDRGIQ